MEQRACKERKTMLKYYVGKIMGKYPDVPPKVVKIYARTRMFIRL